MGWQPKHVFAFSFPSAVWTPHAKLKVWKPPHIPKRHYLPLPSPCWAPVSHASSSSALARSMWGLCLSDRHQFHPVKAESEDCYAWKTENSIFLKCDRINTRGVFHTHTWRQVGIKVRRLTWTRNRSGLECFHKGQSESFETGSSGARVCACRSEPIHPCKQR